MSGDELVEYFKNGPPLNSEHYWEYNMPLQAFANSDGSASILNYMPRKQWAVELDEPVPAAMRESFFNTAADKLENLAKLMRLFAAGKIRAVYYHDESPEKAIEDAKELDN